jgi:hypothetical protein
MSDKLLPGCAGQQKEALSTRTRVERLQIGADPNSRKIGIFTAKNAKYAKMITAREFLRISPGSRLLYPPTP